MKFQHFVALCTQNSSVIGLQHFLQNNNIFSVHKFAFLKCTLWSLDMHNLVGLHAASGLVRSSAAMRSVCRYTCSFLMICRSCVTIGHRLSVPPTTKWHGISYRLRNNLLCVEWDGKPCTLTR